MPWDLRPGDEIRRKELHRQYGGGGQGGISPSRTSPNVLIFSDLTAGSQHGYIYDAWDAVQPGLFHYTGEGQFGDQQMIRGNRAIFDHAEDGRAIRLFDGVRGDVRYVGEMEFAGPAFEMRPAHESGGAKVREVIVFHLQAVDLAAKTDRTPRSDRVYRRPNPSPSKAPEQPWTRDPNVLDRSLKAHWDTQNALHDFLALKGVGPWSPRPAEPDFDLAWERSGVVYVAEVKSLPDSGTEDRQLRLGIGQVLDYQALMARQHQQVRADLAVERQPTDPRWILLCTAHGINLVWPGAFGALV